MRTKFNKNFLLFIVEYRNLQVEDTIDCISLDLSIDYSLIARFLSQFTTHLQTKFLQYNKLNLIGVVGSWQMTNKNIYKVFRGLVNNKCKNGKIYEI